MSEMGHIMFDRHKKPSLSAKTSKDVFEPLGSTI